MSMKKVWNIASTVLVWFMVVVAVGMMIFTIVSVNTFNRNDRDIFGYKAYIVLSDSMSATDFSAGDLVLVKEVNPSELKEGDIIAFQSQNAENYGETVTHKIRALTTTANGDPGFITYGTTTGVDDESIVTYPFILGRYEFAISKLGSFFLDLKTPMGYVKFILIPFLFLIIYQGINCVKIFRQYKREQMEELEAEKAAIQAEREKSEAMMAELLSMKRQMEATQTVNPVPVAAAPPVVEVQPVVEQPVVEAQPVVEQPKQENADMDAILAELAALRAQLAEKESKEEKEAAEVK